MSSIVTFWMDRIKVANPIVAAIALDIARQSSQDVGYDAEAAIQAKLAEWQESADSRTGRALRFAVIYYQEDVRAKAG